MIPTSYFPGPSVETLLTMIGDTLAFLFFQYFNFFKKPIATV
jgi:hypothetical protein